MPGAGEPGMGLSPLVPQGGPANFSLAHVGVDLPVLYLYLSYWSHHGLFFFFFSMGTNVCLWAFSLLFFYNLVVILMWSWEEVSKVFVYSVTLTGNSQRFFFSFAFLQFDIICLGIGLFVFVFYLSCLVFSELGLWFSFGH